MVAGGVATVVSEPYMVQAGLDAAEPDQADPTGVEDGVGQGYGCIGEQMLYLCK